MYPSSSVFPSVYPKRQFMAADTASRTPAARTPSTPRACLIAISPFSEPGTRRTSGACEPPATRGCASELWPPTNNGVNAAGGERTAPSASGLARARSGHDGIGCACDTELDREPSDRPGDVLTAAKPHLCKTV